MKKNCDWHIRIKFFEHIASEDKTERHEMYQPFGGQILAVDSILEDSAGTAKPVNAQSSYRKK